MLWTEALGVCPSFRGVAGYVIPKFYSKQYYSVDAAVHRRIVRGRSKIARKDRAPPPRRPRPVEKKKLVAVEAAK